MIIFFLFCPIFLTQESLLLVTFALIILSPIPLQGWGWASVCVGLYCWLALNHHTCKVNPAHKAEIIVNICKSHRWNGNGDLWDRPTFQAIEALRHNLCTWEEISISQRLLRSLLWLMKGVSSKWSHRDLGCVRTCFDMYSASYLWW